MGTPLRDIIKQVTIEHLDNGYMVMGQCLTAVGWVGGTLPETRGAEMTEIPITDVAGAGFAVGAALMGKRPIYVIRYQGFNWLAAAPIVNYAAKSMEMWERPCTMLIRSIAMEGGMGPVAGSSHHALYYRMPGLKILSPMTPGEYRRAYADFLSGDDVVYFSEHRGSYGNDKELPDILRGDQSDVTLFPISITRFAAMEAAQILQKRGVSVSVCHLYSLKPLVVPAETLCSLAFSKFGVVLDDDYTDGIAKSIAFDLSSALDKKSMYVMGLDNRTAGFSPRTDNLPPTAEQIVNFVLHRI